MCLHPLYFQFKIASEGLRGVQEEEMGKNSVQTIFKDIIGENFPELKKDDPSD